MQKAKVVRERYIDTNVDLGGGTQQDQKSDLRKLNQDLTKAPQDRHSTPEKNTTDWLRLVVTIRYVLFFFGPAALSMGGWAARWPPRGILWLPSWGLSPSLGRVSPGAVLGWAMEEGVVGRRWNDGP